MSTTLCTQTILSSFRRRVPQVLESGVIRRTHCVVDAVDPRITSKSQHVHSVDIQRPNCAHVSFVFVVVEVTQPLYVTMFVRYIHIVDGLTFQFFCFQTIGPLRRKGGRPLEPVACVILKLFDDDSVMDSVKVVRLNHANRNLKM